MQEMECEIPCSDAVLAGTLTLPSEAGGACSVLMLPGSGPLDRDENTRGQRLDIFNTIAHHLAAQGVASLRYDKRGCGQSSGNYLAASYLDFVADAVSCFDWLRHQERCANDRLYLLGHSEGTLTAMDLALQRRDVAGIVQLCPVVEDFESALMRQARQLQDEVEALPGLRGIAYRVLFGNQVAAQRKLIDRVRSNRARPHEVESKRVGVKWLRQVLELDPAQLYAQLQWPLLLIAGAKDLQCNAAGVSAMLKLVPAPAAAHVLPNLTHVLRSDDDQPSIFRYPKLIKRPLEGLVLKLISEWLRNQA
jgi:uncharacterized protein